MRLYIHNEYKMCTNASAKETGETSHRHDYKLEKIYMRK
jgi:hypothetical protein